MKRATFLNSYGPWALVTGASSGIGRAFTYDLASRGLNLILVARNETVLDQMASDIQEMHRVKTIVVAADVGTPGGLKEVSKQLNLQEVGLLVSSAGFGTSGPFAESDLSEEIDMVHVNCIATVELTHAATNQMKKRGRGGVILLASLVGWQGVPLSATYSASKGFVQCFAEAIHFELRQQNIDVLSVAPGPVLSSFDQRANMKIKRGATPEQVASESLRALGRKTTVIPGGLSKVLTYSLFIAPRSLKVRIMGRIMSGLSNYGK